MAHRISKIPYIEIQCEINGTLEIATSKFSKSFKIPKFLDAKITARSTKNPKTRPPNQSNYSINIIQSLPITYTFFFQIFICSSQIVFLNFSQFRSRSYDRYLRSMIKLKQNNPESSIFISL